MDISEFHLFEKLVETLSEIDTNIEKIRRVIAYDRSQIFRCEDGARALYEALDDEESKYRDVKVQYWQRISDGFLGLTPDIREGMNDHAASNFIGFYWNDKGRQDLIDNHEKNPPEGL